MTSENIRVLKDLGPNDVLLGRGTGPNEHVGNIRFRAMVRDIIQTGASKRGIDGKTKAELAKKVIQKIKSEGGRFVRRVGGGQRSKDGYEEVDDALALDKTKQSFRHQLRAILQSSQPHRMTQGRHSKVPMSILKAKTELSGVSRTATAGALLSSSSMMRARPEDLLASAKNAALLDGINRHLLPSTMPFSSPASNLSHLFGTAPINGVVPAASHAASGLLAATAADVEAAKMKDLATMYLARSIALKRGTALQAPVSATSNPALSPLVLQALIGQEANNARVSRILESKKVGGMTRADYLDAVLAEVQGSGGFV